MKVIHRHNDGPSILQDSLFLLFSGIFFLSGIKGGDHQWLAIMKKAFITNS